MQRVRGKGLGTVFFGNPVEHGRSANIDNNRDNQNRESPPGGLNRLAFKKQPVQGFQDYPQASNEKQKSFRQGGKIFGLAMSEWVMPVGRRSGPPDSKKCYRSSHKIQKAVQGFGYQSNTVACKASRKFEEGKQCRPDHAGGSGLAFFGIACFGLLIL